MRGLLAHGVFGDSVVFPRDTWLRLLLWMGAGLVIYAAYGRRHSRVRASNLR